ncbi:ATP-binding protein [Rhodoligotrophos ferricapiens]|uniref:ATP-binding protein n=1 Tax=Rhodoligotrophos ferricapiens TaxID=3069264 RepID=UPI00315DED1C
MNDQPEPIRLEDYSLDEVVRLLTAGVPVHRANEDAFRLDTDDKRKAFAFYGRNRDLWPRNRTVQAKEVEGLLTALEAELPAATARTSRSAGARPIWHLERVEAHRFGGLHRHLGPNGEDPDDFVLDINREITLVSGFNGAGKTALLSAVIWCLTGKALRSQHMPHEVHEPMAVEWTADSEAIGEGDNRPEIAIPPIVPIPSAENLEKLADQPKLDTWVRLTFKREDTAEIRSVTRRVQVSGKKLTAPVEGLDALGIPALALEVGTLMPGVAAHMRFDEKTDFTQAVSQLTGLKPLEELGHRSTRLVGRLRNAEKRTTEEARDQKTSDFASRLQTLVENWEERSDLGTPPRILMPGEEEGEGENKAGCASSIAAARKALQELQSEMMSTMETILGRRVELTSKQDADAMTGALDAAAERLKGGALRELPSIGTILSLSEISEEEASDALKAVEDILARARALATRLEDERKATRWRLYARVADWHKNAHPDSDVVNCPVCGTDLDEVPPDALLDMSVKAALEKCREADSDIAKTASEWERDEAASLLHALPESLRGFADKALPDTLLAIVRKGYVDELLAHRAFSGRLEPLQRNAQAVWEIAARENPLPDAPQPANSKLPELFAGSTLQKRLAAIVHALMLRAHRAAAGDVLKQLMVRYVGAPQSAEDQIPAEREQAKPQERSLRDQIEAIRRGVQNASPILSLIRQLDELERVRQAWEAEEKRLKLLERAADAVEPFLEFPALVYERVSGLINTLDRDTGTWLGNIYRPHYRGGPDYGGFEPGEDGGFGLRAGLGDMRVPAHQVMNASLLRACVWAFLFGLWEHVRTQSGGLSCILLDDPQTHFDPINSENFAATVPKMPSHGMRPLIASNDIRFVASVQDKLPSRAEDAPTWTALRLDPVSSSRLTASLSPAIEEIRERRDRWIEDENDSAKAQEFVKCVRVDIENRLWNLLATDPLVMHSPTLGDLLGQLRHARNAGERPFEEPPFEKLLTHQALRDSALFYKIINKAHHQPSMITPQDAADVNEVYESVHSLLRSCTASYARFLGRLTHEERDLVQADAPSAPEAMVLPDTPLPMLGTLAARSAADILAVTGDQEYLSLGSLGAVALYVIRGPTLGSVALAGQVVIVSLDRDATEGEPVIALHGSKIYARRFHRDKKDLSRTILAADRSGTERVPPALLVPTAETRVMPIVGVLYDAQNLPGRDEAVAARASDILSRKLAVASIVEDSAYPVIRNGDTVLLEAVDDLTPAKLTALEGRIVAVTARSGGESYGYLKRLGQRIETGARIFENIGLNGQAVCISLGSAVHSADNLTLERLWRVHGVLRSGSH